MRSGLRARARCINFFFSSRRRHTRFDCDWSSDVCSSDLKGYAPGGLPPYPAVVCASVNDVIVHGIPNRGKLQEGDILGLDFGSIFEGFVGDAAITVPVGKVSGKAEALMNTTRECLELAIEEMRPGRHVGDIG